MSDDIDLDVIVEELDVYRTPTPPAPPKFWDELLALREETTSLRSELVIKNFGLELGTAFSFAVSGTALALAAGFDSLVVVAVWSAAAGIWGALKLGSRSRQIRVPR